MGAIKNGLKSGLLSGFIYFLINSVINVFIIIFFIGEIVIAENVPETTAKLSIFFSLLIDRQVFEIFLLGLILSSVFSILLLKYYNLLPGKNLKGKTNVFIIFYWIIFFVIVPIATLGLTIIIAWPYLITYIIANLFTSLLLGHLLIKYNSRYLTDNKEPA